MRLSSLYIYICLFMIRYHTTTLSLVPCINLNNRFPRKKLINHCPPLSTYMNPFHCKSFPVMAVEGQLHPVSVQVIGLALSKPLGMHGAELVGLHTYIEMAGSQASQNLLLTAKNIQVKLQWWFSLTTWISNCITWETVDVLIYALNKMLI